MIDGPARALRRAVESVLLQQTSFEYEVVLVDNGLTDAGSAVPDQFGPTQRDRIRIVSSEEGLSRTERFLAAWESCASEFVASLNADDYWVSPYKLQRQLELLEHR